MTDYIKYLRQFVGNRPIFQCGASVIIIDALKRVLMLHRTDNDCWCFPGGSMELGENSEETAIREAKEETGLDIEDLRIFNVFSGKELYYKYPNGDEVYNVDIVYVCCKYTGQLSLNEESKNVEFFDISELPQNISPPVIPIVEKLKENFYSILSL